MTTVSFDESLNFLGFDRTQRQLLLVQKLHLGRPRKTPDTIIEQLCKMNRQPTNFSMNPLEAHHKTLTENQRLTLAQPRDLALKMVI